MSASQWNDTNTTDLFRELLQKHLKPCFLIGSSDDESKTWLELKNLTVAPTRASIATKNGVVVAVDCNVTVAIDWEIRFVHPGGVLLSSGQCAFVCPDLDPEDDIDLYAVDFTPWSEDKEHEKSIDAARKPVKQFVAQGVMAARDELIGSLRQK